MANNSHDNDNSGGGGPGGGGGGPGGGGGGPGGGGGSPGGGGGGPGGGGPGEFTVDIHLGAEHTTFKTPGTTTLAAVKERGLDDLHIVRDPAFDYLLNYRGELVSDETQTLAHLVGEHGETTVTLHVQKRPKGG